MVSFLKTAALTLTLPGLLAAGQPAAAAVMLAQHASLVQSQMAALGDDGHDRYDGGNWGGDDWGEHNRWEHRDEERQRDWNRDDERRDYARYGYDQGYRYDNPYNDRVYTNTRARRGDDARYYCRRSDGTAGLLVGGAAGALLGREVAGRGGDRTLGAILGAAGGALLGREIDRSNARCR